MRGRGKERRIWMGKKVVQKKYETLTVTKRIYNKS